jgi:hypothetical protein
MTSDLIKLFLKYIVESKVMNYIMIINVVLYFLGTFFDLV